MKLKLDFEESEKRRIEAEIRELEKPESVVSSKTGSVIGFDESEQYTPKFSRGSVKIFSSDGKVSRQPSRKSSISDQSSSSSDTEPIMAKSQSPPIPAERSFKSGTSNGTPRIYGKARNKGSKRPNTGESSVRKIVSVNRTSLRSDEVAWSSYGYGYRHVDDMSMLVKIFGCW